MLQPGMVGGGDIIGSVRFVDAEINVMVVATRYLRNVWSYSSVMCGSVRYSTVQCSTVRNSR